MQQDDRIVTPRRNRLRVGLGAAVVLLVIGLGVAVLVSALGSHGETRVITSPTPTSSTTGGGSSGTAIYVHMLGAVARPGLFVLKDGDRAVDALAAAGGFVEGADQSQLNLARLLVDGEQIVVPLIGEAPPAAVGAGGAGAAGGKVNLNTADATALETLPRVGPAMASRIIAWRTENGRFGSVEDLMSVSGVGDKTFEQLKDLVTI